MRRIGLIVLTLSIGLCFGKIRLTEDKPLMAGPRAGGITGRIRTTEKMTRLRAISRVTGKTYPPRRFDAKTGRFEFRDLPGDARYDICFQVGDVREIEGIDLDFVDQRLVRLADTRRKQLALPPERAHTFSERDVKSLLEFVKGMKEFMEDRRVLYIRGHGRRAVLLVELMRTREFYSSGAGEYVWRIELWYFVNQFGGWEKLANQERVLRRLRTGAAQWRNLISVEYYPQLSVYVTAAGKSEPVEFAPPAKPDASRGRIAGTHPKTKTAPHVILPGRPRPTTAPAGTPKP